MTIYAILMNHPKNKHPYHIVINGLLDMAFPELCLLCNTPLNHMETCICLDCLYHLPKNHYTSYTENKSAELFYGKLPFVKAVSGFTYQKESSLQTAIELLKYKGKKEVGKVLGSMVGLSLQQGGFFTDIDVLVPVPLHPNKYRKRGFNQSEWIAKGVSETSGLPIDTKSLLRVTDSKTQTRKPVFERWKNVSSVFIVGDREAIKNKHILLIDDVLTTGSTLEACGRAVLSAEGCRVSFLTLARA